MTIQTWLIVAALVSFAIAVIGIPCRVNLVALGLAFYMGALLIKQ